MASITMTSKDGRFSSQVGVVSAINTLEAFTDLGGKGKILSYLQIDLTAAGPIANKCYFNLYNTAEVTLGTTEPVLRLEIPAADALYNMVIPTGLNLPTAFTFALMLKDNGIITTGNSTPEYTVKFVFT